MVSVQNCSMLSKSYNLQVVTSQPNHWMMLCATSVLFSVLFRSTSFRSVLPYTSNKLGRVSDWASMRFFSICQLSNGDGERSEIWHKSSLGDEDDAWTLNLHIAQRKRVTPHSMLKNNHRNIIECCNNIHQGAPCRRTLTGFTKMCCTCNTSP